MSWFKEVAKTCLNLAVLVLGVFVFGFVANPNWKWWYLLAGLFLAAWFGLFGSVGFYGKKGVSSNVRSNPFAGVLCSPLNDHCLMAAGGSKET
jgi:hypothetical protein